MTTISQHAAYARTMITDFLGWWRSELLDMVPPALRARLRRRTSTVIFDADGGTVRAMASGQDGLRMLGTWAAQTSDTDAGRAWAADILRGVERRRCKVGFRVPAAAALHRTLTLPWAVLENLRQAISYDLDRLTPYRAEEVVFEARVATRDRVAGTCTVELVVVSRAALSRIRDEASRLGIQPDFIDAPPHPDTPGITVDLLPRLDEPAAAKTSWLTTALAMFALTLGAAAMAIPLVRQSMDAEQAAAALEAAHLEAEYAARLRREIEDLEAARSMLYARRSRTPDALQILHALTVLLPDDSYLSQWEITGGRLQLMGYARSAATILAAIEASPLFEETTFRAPVMLSPQDGREHFQIVAGFAAESGS